MDTVERGAVVVGHDGAPASTGALHFAVAEARRRGASLRVVHALPLASSAFLDFPILAQDIEAATRRIEASLRTEVARVAEDVDVEVICRRGVAAAVLRDAAEDATVLVLGREQRSGLQRLIGGATTEGVVARAGTPVVVVPESWRSDQSFRQRVVVAIKAPEHSTELLGAAFLRAEESGAALRVVHAWRTDDRLGDLRADRWTPPELVVDRAAATIEELLRPWRRAYPSVVASVEAHAADPLIDLLEETTAADLIVLLRGDSPVLGPHLGSVLRPVLRAADCPVLVVPAVSDSQPPLDLELERAGSLLR